MIKELYNYGITKPKMLYILNLFRNHPYFKIYSDPDNCKKGIDLLLCFYVNNNSAIRMEYIIPGFNQSVVKNYSSYILINFTEILTKMN